jgi:hypothetical protein
MTQRNAGGATGVTPPTKACEENWAAQAAGRLAQYELH